MTLSVTTHIATAIGFAPGQDIGSLGDATMSISTTTGSQMQSTGDINFQRAFVETSQQEMISIDNGAFVLEIPNTNSFSGDIYILAMSTNASPGAVPIGYSLAGSAYNVKPSGSLTQSEKIMTLLFTLPSGTVSQTLAIMSWDAFNEQWNFEGGALLQNGSQVELLTQRFGIYALATTPFWRDSFYNVSGVASKEFTEVDNAGTGLNPGDLILNSGRLTGTATSIPITPTNATNWGTLNFSATITPGTELAVDLLDAGDNVVMANLSAGADLSGIALSTYPTLKLRATLTSTTAESPKLHEWQLSWQPKEEKIYLPLILKNQS